MRQFIVIVGLVASARISPGAQRPAPVAPRADLILTNGRIYTVDDSRPVVAALAVSDGRVQFAGSEREVVSLKGPATRVVDLHGGVVIPGMVDAHAHLLSLGLGL